MAEAGAKVLNAQAVQFAKEAKIALYARDTFNPGKETIIKDVTKKELSGVLAVVYEKEIVRVFIHDAAKINWVLEYLEAQQIPIKEFQVSGIAGDKGYKCSFIISTNSLYNWEKIKEALEEKLRDGIYVNESLAALSIIGEGFSRNNDALMETMKLLDRHGINYYGVNTTSFRISLLVEKYLLEDAVKLCHEYWIK
jgi:aspartate kinase